MTVPIFTIPEEEEEEIIIEEDENVMETPPGTTIPGVVLPEEEEEEFIIEEDEEEGEIEDETSKRGDDMKAPEPLSPSNNSDMGGGEFMM